MPKEKEEEETVRLLSEVDAKGKPLPPKPDLSKDRFAGMWWPRTRLALGLIFIGVLIYDMVSLRAHYHPLHRLMGLPAHKFHRSRASG